MSDFLEQLFRALLFVLYMLAFPIVMLVATPFVLLWPGRKRPDGSRRPRKIAERYARVMRFYKSIGLGVATLHA